MVLYRQHQLELTLPSARNDNFKPGWYPDPLIPFRQPPNARFKAVPFDLPAGETHGFWVDIFVPANATPGKYRGTFRVNAATIPVGLTVWDFELPRVSTLQTALGSPAERMRGYYAKRAKAGKEPEPKDWDAVEAQVADEVSRHRINATPPSALLTPQKEADGCIGSRPSRWTRCGSSWTPTTSMRSRRRTRAALSKTPKPSARSCTRG